jgi:methylase of polypeptide subunit release factors
MKIDCTNLFSQLNPRERTEETVEIDAPEYTYLPEGEPVEGWLPKVLRGFLAYRSKRGKVKTAAIVGCGPGVDAVLMVEVLNPQTLVLTDLDHQIVEVAKKNVLKNCTHPPELRDTSGDLCEGLTDIGLRFDLLYENLPNLPAQASVNISQGVLSASFFDDTKYQNIPEEYNSHLLGLHYEFLQKAKGCLKEGGDVICCIGARVPVELIFKMFKSSGYEPEVLVLDLVRQFEAERVLAEYARIERESKIKFKFFDLDKADKHLVELAKTGLEPSELIKQLDEKAKTISAEEAAWRHGLGGRIGVVGLVILGRLSKD